MGGACGKTWYPYILSLSHSPLSHSLFYFSSLSAHHLDKVICTSAGKQALPDGPYNPVLFCDFTPECRFTQRTPVVDTREQNCSCTIFNTRASTVWNWPLASLVCSYLQKGLEFRTKKGSLWKVFKNPFKCNQMVDRLWGSRCSFPW